MQFKDAIDQLGARVTHGAAAKALGVSVPSVRQYRLPPDAKAHRVPPTGWEKVLASLARRRAVEMIALADKLEESE